MNKIYIVLMPEGFIAQEYEDKIKEIISNELDSDEDQFSKYKNSIMSMLKNFAKGPGVIYDDDNEYDLPISASDIIIPLCEELECIISSYETYGDQFIINLREFDDKITELL